jgi:hypothetical protein
MIPIARAMPLRHRPIVSDALPRHTATSVVFGVLTLVAVAAPPSRADQGDPATIPNGPVPSPPNATPTRADRSARSSLPIGVGNDDPPVDILCKAAVALALAEPERARSFISRARLAGWLPEMHLRAYRRFARTEGLTLADAGSGALDPIDINTVDDVRYEWRASWDLSRMVFNPDELQAHLEALRMSDIRRDIQSLVIKLYFERRRLLVERVSSSEGRGPADAPGAEKRVLRVAEIEAQLDAMSGGAFSSGGGIGRRQAAPAP